MTIPRSCSRVQMFKLFMFSLRPVKRRRKSPFRYDCRNYRQPYWCWRFFSLHEQKNPSHPGEHEGYNLILFDNLIPSAGEQVVDQGGDVADVDAAVLVAVGGCQTNA